MVRRTSIRDGKVEKKWERDETTREKQIKGREGLESEVKEEVGDESLYERRGTTQRYLLRL